MSADYLLLIKSLLANYPYASGTLADVLADSTEAMEIKDEVLTIKFSVPVAKFDESLANTLYIGFEAQGIKLNAVEFESQIPQAPTPNFSNQVSGVKNIIAVASGKGGVGKSTTAVNLALALAKEGARVGVLDADIYGPSQPTMLGLDGQRPEVRQGNRIVPLQAHGLQMISMGNLVNENTPMVWRGPMVSGALQQLLLNTDWDKVDYLIIDMPPGTGDIPLTLSQKVPVTGSVIVTTPQDIALLDAKKGIEMFNKVNIPVFGVVENMAVHICSNCGHEEHIFGKQGGQQLAQEYKVATLGSLPLALDIRLHTDQGKPSVIAEPESSIALKYQEIAKHVAAAVASSADRSVPEINIS